MTNIGKSLVVAIFFASIVFMASALAVYFGGINWEGLAQSSEHYDIQPVEGPVAHQYQASNRVTGDPAGSTGILPNVLIATLKDETGNLKQEIRALDEKIKGVQNNLDKYKQLIEVDQAGLKSQAARLDQEIDATVQSTKELSQKLIRLTTQANEILQEAQNRREDITRLKRQLDEIKTENFRLTVQKEKLADLLTRYKEIVHSLKRRQQQLMKQIDDKVAEAN